MERGPGPGGARHQIVHEPCTAEIEKGRGGDQIGCGFEQRGKPAAEIGDALFHVNALGWRDTPQQARVIVGQNPVLRGGQERREGG